MDSFTIDASGAIVVMALMSIVGSQLVARLERSEKLIDENRVKFETHTSLPMHPVGQVQYLYLSEQLKDINARLTRIEGSLRTIAKDGKDESKLAWLTSV